MTNAERRIAAISTGQLGIFSRAQAIDAGLSHRQLRRRVQSGSLIPTGPNTFRVAGSPPSIESGLLAMVLDVGAPVLVAGPTAAALHGFAGWTLRRPFHLLVPADRNVRRNGAIIHRSDTIGPLDRDIVGDLPVTSGVRTLIDLARVASPKQLDAAIGSLFDLGLASTDLLFRRIAQLRSRGRYGIPLLLGVLERRMLEAGVESWLEAEYLRLITGAGLPRPLLQQVLTRAGDRIVRVDCRFPGTNVVVELLGYQYHRTRQQFQRDAERLNALIVEGYAPYQFTYDDVANAPAVVVATTAAALLRARTAA